jgi:hypothetical protein
MKKKAPSKPRGVSLEVPLSAYVGGETRFEDLRERYASQLVRASSLSPKSPRN